MDCNAGIRLSRDLDAIVRSSLDEAAGRYHGLRGDKLFGTKSVWRHQNRVAVSDVHRTAIDMLDDPAVGDGIQHVADCLAADLRRAERATNVTARSGSS